MVLRLAAVADSSWYDMVNRAIAGCRSSLRRVRYVTWGRVFERSMMDLYTDVSILAKFLATIGGPYFVTEIRRILTDFRRDWEAYKILVIPFADLSATVEILISEVESSMEVARCLPSRRV